jgi:hypothetical protein
VTVKEELKNAGKTVQSVGNLPRGDKPGSPHMNWHEPQIMHQISRRLSTVSSGYYYLFMLKLNLICNQQQLEP